MLPKRRAVTHSTPNGDKLEVTRSDGVNFAISAAETTGSGDAASVKVDQSTDGSTAAAENTAADIVTALAGTSSVGGYTFAEVGGALKVTRSDGVDFEILAGVKTGSGGDAASDAVARSTNGSTVASENTAADIVTGLAGTSSVGGYTFAEVGGALKVTRSDGVDFEILAGVKTGSGGDAASDAVARSTNGSTVASENTAADIVTGLAGTSSVGGYTFAEVGGALKVTRSDGVDFEILAGVKTGSGGDAASDAVARSTNGSTVASENTAADIVTGLAGTSSVGGYTFAEVGGALKVTRSDGVDFEILAGVKTGSGGDAASDAVARSTNGTLEVVYTPVKLTLSSGEVTYSTYDGLSRAKADADTALTNYYGSNGAGKGFADADAVAAEIGTAAVGNSPATGLMKALADGRTLEAAETAYFTTGAGKDYSNSADISGTISDLQTLLDSNDSNNEADTVTGFFDTHNGVGNARDIDDLADLNGQIANSIVTRNIGVSNATPQTVKLTTAEVDRLGEGAVQVEVTQTDKVGNLHAGDAATKSFVIDTIVPEVVSITDNQSGIAFDGADTVAYTLTFTENLQEIDANDLNVTGANIVSVVHSAGSKTATVNVKVDQDSVSDVVITAKPSILDIAGNPLVQAVNDSQDVDTRNPTASYASEIKSQNTNGTADVSSDADRLLPTRLPSLSRLRASHLQTLILLAAH